MKPLVWSYTFNRDFDNCPRKAHHRYVLRDLGPFVETDEIKYGNVVHDALNNRTRNVPLPAEMGSFEPYALALQPYIDADQVRGEWQLGVRLDGSPCDFFDNEVFMRGKIDVTIMPNAQQAHITDWKTGNDKYEDPMELEGNAIMLSAHHPRLTVITGNFVWLKTDRIGITYNLTERLPDRWSKIVNLMTVIIPSMDVWPPRPNPLCSYCPVGPKKCEHWKPPPPKR